MSLNEVNDSKYVYWSSGPLNNVVGYLEAGHLFELLETDGTVVELVRLRVTFDMSGQSAKFGPNMHLFLCL
jgi:hypothetical protein